MFLSIIVPIFNTKEYIKNCLDSLIRQASDDFEVILVDDGSTDGSLEYAESIIENSSIKYKTVRQKNQGVSAARNRGIEIAEGDYLYFLDSDDFVHEEFIKTLITKANEDSYDLIMFGYNNSSDSGIVWNYKNDYEYIEDLEAKESVLMKYLQYKIHIYTSNVIYKRSLIEDNNLKYLEGCHNGEDQNFIIKAVVQANKFGCIKTELMSYYQRDNSITHSVSPRRLTIVDAFKDLINYLLDNNVSDEVINIIANKRYVNNLVDNFWTVSKDQKNRQAVLSKIQDKQTKDSLRKFKLDNFTARGIVNYLKTKSLLYTPKIFTHISNKIG